MTALLVTPTLTDCRDRDVHHFICGRFAKHPDCGHSAEFKECKNCGKVVWVRCVACLMQTTEERRKNLWREPDSLKIIEQNRKLGGHYLKPSPVAVKGPRPRRKEQNQK